MVRPQEFVAGPHAMADEDDVDDVFQSGDGRGESQGEAIVLLTYGNQAFRSFKFKEAISVYTKALHGHFVDQSVLHSNRSAAFCRLSQHLRKIPAAVSEGSALYELDPMALGQLEAGPFALPSHRSERYLQWLGAGACTQLALRDAEKVIKLRGSWPKAYLRKAAAQTLLEQYEAAKDTYFSGLELDPTSKALQAGLHEVTAHLEGAEHNGQERRKLERSDELDCTLCLKLLHQPITTPCGHSFCRGCLLQALDHGNKCPMCRTVLFVSPKTFPVSVTLNNLIQRNFPEEYEERKAEMDAITLSGEEMLPLFVMDVVLPLQCMTLNIFEPRYRLMVRRIMEGNHRMGMVGIDAETGLLAEVACEVEISEFEPLADGRFRIEVVGKRRFRIIETWEQDGYRVAKVQWMQDAVPAVGSPEAERIDRAARTATDMVTSYISQAQEAFRTDRRLLEFLNRAGRMPSTTDPERFSFWVANLLHTRTAERLQYLRITDTEERLSQEISGWCRLTTSSQS